MGQVYRARDAGLRRDVAVKVLSEGVANDADRLARFEREAHVLASLNHPNIAAIYGLERLGDTPLLIMEFVPGETLAERLQKGACRSTRRCHLPRRLPRRWKRRTTRASCIATSSRPMSIVTPEGQVKVLDFGLAKHLAGTTRLIPGTICRTRPPWQATRVGRTHRGHRRIHESGTSARQGRGQANRHLVVRLCALRDAGRGAGLRG